MTGKTRRALCGASFLILPSALLIGWLAWQDTLPPVLPTHWEGSGTPDGFATTTSYTTIIGALLIGAMLIGQAACLRGGEGARWWAAGAGMVQGLMTSLWFVPVLLTRASGDPATARLDAWIVVLIASIGWGFIPAALYPVSRLTVETRRITPMSTAAPEPWQRDVTSRLFLAVWAMMIVVALGLGILSLSEGVVPAIVGGVIVLLSVPVALISTYRVNIDERGVRVTSRGVPLARLPLEDIADSRVEELVPIEWGGWGWRLRPGGSAIITRRGPGLAIIRLSGRMFAVSVPDAESGQAVLEAYIVKHRCE